MSTGQWYHVAYVRESGTLKIYFNGTVDSTTQSYSGQLGKTGTVYLGDQHAGGGGAPQYYIDDLRVTKGLARYTSNFTAPTTAHLTSAGDSLKQIIVNEDADGVIVGTSGINASRIAKAWVNFNGTGTVAIRSSYNVSSITDNGTGDYSVVFSTAMSDANYCTNVSSGDKAYVFGIPIFDGVSNYTSSLCRFLTQHPDDSAWDNPIVCASFFGN